MILSMRKTYYLKWENKKFEAKALQEHDVTTYLKIC